jgi:hypothetical protein
MYTIGPRFQVPVARPTQFGPRGKDALNPWTSFSITFKLSYSVMLAHGYFTVVFHHIGWGVNAELKFKIKFCNILIICHIGPHHWLHGLHSLSSVLNFNQKFK